jgi:hypothetical protein
MSTKLPVSAMDKGQPLGIACGTGGFKGVFLTGVLHAFETRRLRADMYAAASSSVLPAGYAALGRSLGAGYWHKGLQLVEREGLGMSAMILISLGAYGPYLRERLFLPGAPRFLIAANRVMTDTGRATTQGAEGRRLGRKLLLAAAGRDPAWADDNLSLHVFDSQAGSARLDPAVDRLDPGNFGAVAYASTRMLHAWDIPAWLGAEAYVDAAYTCACPAVPLAERGCRKVLAVLNEPGPPYLDLFGARLLPERWNSAEIQVIQPEVDPAELGVEYTTATPEGIDAVFGHGLEVGARALEGLGWLE